MTIDKVHHITDLLNQAKAACNRCITECLMSENIKYLTSCIKLNLDCMEMCTMTASFISRDSIYATHMMKECAEICNACASECEKHADMECCVKNAELCRQCANLCLSFVSPARTKNNQLINK